MRTMLYKALIKSKLEYGIGYFWQCSGVKSLTLRKRAIRWIKNVKAKARTGDNVQKLKLMKIRDPVPCSHIKIPLDSPGFKNYPRIRSENPGTI